MNYEVHIIDRDALADPLVLHYASKDSIELNWLGGEDLLQPIIGSECNFNLEVLHGEDAKYDQYFVSDEKRWIVKKLISETQEVIWTGYLLPESYSEPYSWPLFYVDFSAVDGLGLLKGKKLPLDFYSEEKPVIEVIAACLELTKIDYDIYFAPAIQNHLKKNWHDLFIDTQKFYDEDELPSAHDFLEQLVFSMQCQLYQSQGRWYIEGINKRRLLTVKFWKYSISGDFKGIVDVTKQLKKAAWIGSEPIITMVPALKEVVVTQESPSLDITTKTYQDAVIPGIVSPGVNGSFLPQHWDYNFFQPKMEKPDYYLSFPLKSDRTFHPENKIDLRRKPYVLKGTKVRIKMAFQFKGYTTLAWSAFVENGQFTDIMVYRISLNDTVLFYNETSGGQAETTVQLNESGAGEVSLEFIIKDDGYINIELFEPLGVTGGFVGPLRIQLTNLSIEDIEQKEDLLFKEIVDEASSVIQKVDLDFSDDYSGNTKSFYLEKTRELEYGFDNFIEVPILYGRQQNGKNYAIISLEGAMLIDQYPISVSYNYYYATVGTTNVIYNLNGGEEMAVETDAFYNSGKFLVLPKPYKKLTTSRLEWLKWTDAIYGVEEKRYGQVVADIRRNLYGFPHLSINGILEFPVKFNDIIEFRYKGVNKYFIITKANWNSNAKESVVTLVEALYKGEGLGNTPPFVDAGKDISIGVNDTTAQIETSAVSDPDGFIVSLLWERISGDTGEVYSSNTVLKPLISNLTGENYEFRLTAIDNVGAIGSDTMFINRVREYYLILTETSHVLDNDAINIETKTYSLNVTPSLLDNEQVILDFRAIMIANGDVSQNYFNGFITIVKNGVVVFQLKDDSSVAFFSNNYEAAGSVSVTKEDVTEVIFNGYLDNLVPADILFSIQFRSATFQNAVYNQVLGLPYGKLYNMQRP